MWIPGDDLFATPSLAPGATAVKYADELANQFLLSTRSSEIDATVKQHGYGGVSRMH